MTGSRNTWPCAWLLLAGVAAAVPPAVAERQPYDRYQSIVDRQMFGPLPAGFDPTKSPSEVSKSAGSASEKELTKEQEKVKSSIRFSVINVTPDGDTAIGFTDNSNPKAPVHYYMKVGESRGGWEVKEADAKAATMTIVKDGVEVSLSLGGDSSKGAAAAGGGKDVAAAGAHAPRSPLLGTLGGRRRAKIEREEAAAREAAKVAAEREAEMKAREEERARREEEDKAQRAAEREESRRQLLQIQEELRKAREARQFESKEKESGGDGEALSESE